MVGFRIAWVKGICHGAESTSMLPRRLDYYRQMSLGLIIETSLHDEEEGEDVSATPDCLAYERSAFARERWHIQGSFHLRIRLANTTEEERKEQETLEHLTRHATFHWHVLRFVSKWQDEA